MCLKSQNFIFATVKDELDIKTLGFLTFPAANGIAGTGLCYGFISFGFSLIKVFDHLLEFRI